MTEKRFEDRMSDADALMWNIEKDPMLRSTIMAVTILDSAPDRVQVADKLERGTRRIPRLRQRPVSSPLRIAPPRWMVDPHFDAGYHLRYLRADGEGTLRELLDMAAPITMQGFDRARPPWEMFVVEGLEGGRAAILQKIHHAVTDGVGGIEIALMLLDSERDPAPDTAPLPPAPEPEPYAPFDLLRENLGFEQGRLANSARNLLTGLPGVVGDPRGNLRRADTTLRSALRMTAPASEPLSPLLKPRSLSCRFDSVSASLSELKAAAKRADGRLNDALLAAVAGAFRRYHEHHGVTSEEIRLSMPINLRDKGSETLGGNQFAPARFPMPILIDDPIERMRTVRDLVFVQRSEPALKLADNIAGVLNRLPTSVTTSLFGGMLRGVDCTVSNVPGLPFEVFLGGARIESQFPFGPLAGAAVNITLLSYLDDVNIGVNTDPAAVPDPEVFVACLEEALLEIVKA